MTTDTATCSACQLPIVKPDGLGTGYVQRPDGTRICYDCAHAEQRAQIRDTPPGGRFAGAYLQNRSTWDGPMLRVTDWSGIPFGTVTSIGKAHPFSGRWGPTRRRYITVRMFDGSDWHGVGAPGEYCALTRSKR